MSTAQWTLTAMANIVVSDWGEDRALRIHKRSPLAETLNSIRLPSRDEWFRGYLTRRIAVLLACIVDSTFRLDTVLATPSPAGVSVVEYHILRPMLEYVYKLLDLVQLEIDVKEREKRAIENWKMDYQQFKRVDIKHQSAEHARYFAKWESVLTDWYFELTRKRSISEPNIKEIFNRLADAEAWWPTDSRGDPVNPAYQTGYSVFSAIGHGNLWAVQRYGMNNPSVVSIDPPGLDEKTLLSIQNTAGTFLQYAYGAVNQFMGPALNASVMNKLESNLEIIRKLLAETDSVSEETAST